MTVAVLGIGNVLRRDDGFGPSAVRRLDALYEFPACVELHDLGTPGLDLASHLIGHEAVLFLDAAHCGGSAPGTIRVFGRDEVLAAGARSPRVTGHDGDVREALLVLDLAGRAPRRVALIGVATGDLASGAGLTSAVDAALGPACDRAVAILAGWGVRAVARASARPSGAWWQSAGTRGPHAPHTPAAAPGRGRADRREPWKRTKSATSS